MPRLFLQSQGEANSYCSRPNFLTKNNDRCHAIYVYFDFKFYFIMTNYFPSLNKVCAKSTNILFETAVLLLCRTVYYTDHMKLTFTAAEVHQSLRNQCHFKWRLHIAKQLWKTCCITIYAYITCQKWLIFIYYVLWGLAVAPTSIRQWLFRRPRPRT